MTLSASGVLAGQIVVFVLLREWCRDAQGINSCLQQRKIIVSLLTGFQILFELGRCVQIQHGLTLR